MLPNCDENSQALKSLVRSISGMRSFCNTRRVSMQCAEPSRKMHVAFFRLQYLHTTVLDLRFELSELRCTDTMLQTHDAADTRRL